MASKHSTFSQYEHIRHGLSEMKSDHDASGEFRPTPKEIFAPEQHANALDPNTNIVVGARGTGKSFWAGVLEEDDTRKVASLAYPNLGLDKLIVRAGYTGFDTETAVDPKILAARVPEGKEGTSAFKFWQAVIIRAAHSALDASANLASVGQYMQRYNDQENAQSELKLLDNKFSSSGQVLLVTFDALDTLSRDWRRSTLLLDALFEVVWSLRARKCIRAKVFIRPEQLNDDSLQFVELPKLRSGRVELEWNQVDLYGLLFSRLAKSENRNCASAFRALASKLGAPVPESRDKYQSRWELLQDHRLQKKAIELLAGKYMGRSNKKGGTYDWPYKHLADATGRVTPRSFIKLFSEAARYPQQSSDTVISPEGIRHGLREASKVRVDQLGIEYQWIKRALAPLAGLSVPCDPDAIYYRWRDTNTIEIVLKAASDEETGFMPPFPPKAKGDRLVLLATAMERIGVIAHRPDGRVDIPDLFRVAAKMLRRGGTTLARKVPRS